MPRHDLDVLALVAGAAFIGAGLIFLVNPDVGLSGRWVWPVLLILVGLAGLVGSRTGSRSTPPAPSHGDPKE